MDYKYTGIILSKNNVGETDRIYAVYTKESGKIRFLGKGVRKANAKLAGSLEPITMAEIFVAKSKGIGKITGSIVLDNFSNIKSDADALAEVFYIFNLLSKLIAEQEKDENIFGILSSFLESLDKLSPKENNAEKMDVLVLGFLFKILSEMGYRLEVEKCVHCQEKLKPKNNYFSAEKGGVVCFSCAKKEKRIVAIKDGSVKLIRIFIKNKIESLVRLKVSSGDISNLKIIFRETLNWI